MPCQDACFDALFVYARKSVRAKLCKTKIKFQFSKLSLFPNLKNSEPLPRTVKNEVHDRNRRGDLTKNKDD